MISGFLIGTGLFISNIEGLKIYQTPNQDHKHFYNRIQNILA